MAKTFKTASLAGFGALGDNADTLRAWAMSDPAILEQMGGQAGLDAYIAQHQQALGWNPETSGDFQFSPETQAIDQLLSGYQMNSVGAAGLEDGRAKAIVKDGQTLFTGDPYSYQPAKENLQTALTGMALIGGTAGLQGLLGNIGAGAGAAASGGAEALSGLDAAMLDAGAGLSGGAGGSVVGAGAAGGSMLGGALPELAMPAGNALGGGIGGAATGSTGGLFGGSMGGMLGTALDFAKANPKLVGGLLGGLLGGTGGSSGGSGYSYNGPMPTITRGNWQPSATPQLRQAAPQAVTMPTQGNQYSGLLRYLGG